MKRYDEIPEKKPLSERLFKMVMFIIYPLCAISALIIAPVYTIIHSNVAFSVLPVILKFLNIAVDIFVIYFSLAVAIYGLCKYNYSDIKKVIIFIILSPLFKNLLKMFISPIIDGIPSKDQLFLDFYSLILSALLEMLQLFIIIFVSYQTLKAYKEKLFAWNRAREKIDEKHLPDISLVPFKKVFSISNPLQSSALISMSVVTLIRIGMLLYSDIKNYDSLPNAVGDAILFFGAYLLEIIIGLVGYLLMLYVFIHIASKDEE